MTALDRLKSSNAWDQRFALPLVPFHSNPFIYCAYAHRIFWPKTSQNERDELSSAVSEHVKRCEAEPGYIWRWPWDSNTSHDELLGAAYLDPGFAARAIDFLSRSDGAYDQFDKSIRQNVYRFIFLLPALKSFAGFEVSIFSQAMFGIAALANAYLGKVGEASGTLKIWLCAPAMRKYPISEFCLILWEKKWKSKGQSAKEIFTKHYLTEVPVFGEFAREDFR